MYCNRIVCELTREGEAVSDILQCMFYIGKNTCHVYVYRT